MESWYRQDYDAYPDTHGHAPVTDMSFWFSNDPDNPPTGIGVPFEHAEWELAMIAWDASFGRITKQNVGDALFLGGLALVSPGISYFHVPYTGVAGIVFNVVVGGGMMVTGARLSGRTIDIPEEITSVRAPFEASPLEWGLPDYFTLDRFIDYYSTDRVYS
ncbi:MAG: hypothetical protein [Circoviridae sp.]|nr:MAG: hypothetical protein [Circoviridae sp.]